MSLLKDIPELVKAEIITVDTAEKIRDYYQYKSKQSTNRLFVVFGILGAVLVGLGMILIIAHNWDELSRPIKIFFSILPLILGQLLCGFVLIKKQDNIAWREGGTTFLFLAVGASLSLISQIYNIPGSLASLLLTWMLLCLPLIYVMKSSIASILYIIGITYYACEKSYWSHPSTESYFYWILLLFAVPYYYLSYRNKSGSNFMIIHNWLVPLSIVLALGTVAKRTDELMFIAYFSLFGFFNLVGDLEFFRIQKPLNNGYKTLGSIGTIVLLLILSFNWFWEDLRRNHFQFNEIIISPEFIASAIITTLALAMLYLRKKGKPLVSFPPVAIVFILFIATFLIGLTSPIAAVIINLIVFAIGILIIIDGAKKDHLGVLNYGLLVITVLVVCRFFDTDLSFVLRGSLFVSVGLGFFVANYLILKKRKINE